MSATNAQITVTGNIAAATCDLIVSNAGIDLGTFISSDIKAAGVIAGSTRAFDMSVLRNKLGHFSEGVFVLYRR